MHLGSGDTVGDGATGCVVEEVDSAFSRECLVDSTANEPRSATLFFAAALLAGRPIVCFPPTALMSACCLTPCGNARLTRHVINRLGLADLTHPDQSCGSRLSSPAISGR